MKRKVLSDFVKKTLYVSLICASLCGAVAPSQVEAAINTAPAITSLAKELDKTVGINEQIPTQRSYIVQNDVLLFVDSNLVQTPNGIINYKDSTFIPIAIVSDALGAEVGWDGNLKIAQVTLNGTTVEILNRTNVGIVTKDGKSVQKKITVANSKQSLPALNINGTTYLPTRFVSESLGLNIKWHNSHPETGQKTITIGKETGLNYKKPGEMNNDAKALLAKINKGKVATAPDGKDYNTIYGKYFVGMKQAGFGEDLNTNSGGALINNEQDWNKLFSQKSPTSGKPAISGLFYVDAEGINAVFDHNGDGKLGDIPISQLNSLKDVGKVNAAFTDECFNTGIPGIADYVIKTYNQYGN